MLIAVLLTAPMRQPLPAKRAAQSKRHKTMKTQIITLKISVSDDYDYPENWNWAGILDLGDGENVEMTDYQTINENEA